MSISSPDFNAAAAAADLEALIASGPRATILSVDPPGPYVGRQGIIWYDSNGKEVKTTFEWCAHCWRSVSKTITGWCNICGFTDCECCRPTDTFACSLSSVRRAELFTLYKGLTAREF